MSLSEASHVYQDGTHQAIADGLATQLPGSIETGRAVWAMIVAECSHGGCSMKRLAPQTWTPAVREAISAEARLKTLPSVEELLRTFEIADALVFFSVNVANRPRGDQFHFWVCFAQ